LVLGHLWHGHGETIDQLGMPVFPQPTPLRLLLGLLGHLNEPIVQRSFRPFRTGSPIISRIRGRWLEILELAVTGDASDGGWARGFFAITQHLGKKCPDDDSRAVNATQAEQGTLLGKDPMNPPGAENLGEGEPLPSEESVGNQLETVAAFMRRMEYL
jgi:hypothetical protein